MGHVSNRPAEPFMQKPPEHVPGDPQNDPSIQASRSESAKIDATTAHRCGSKRSPDSRTPIERFASPAQAPASALKIPGVDNHTSPLPAKPAQMDAGLPACATSYRVPSNMVSQTVHEPLLISVHETPNTEGHPDSQLQTGIITGGHGQVSQTSTPCWPQSKPRSPVQILLIRRPVVQGWE